MSDVEAGNPLQNARLLTGLFWIGVGLAPLAGLVLMVGGSATSVKIAAAFALLSVVLVGLSVALRPDPNALRAEMDERLLEEIDILRDDLREDIATAARATHHAFEERVQSLQRTVDALRIELEQARGGVSATPHSAPATGRSVVGAPPPVSAPALPGPAIARAAAPPAPVAEPYPEPDAHRGVAAGRAHVPAGVFRHTETVHHVTTRSTYVDHDEGYQPGHGAESVEADQGWSVPPPRGRRREPEDHPAPAPWSGAGQSGAGQRRRRDDGEAGGGRRQRWEDEPGDVEGWSAHHRDDHSEELRLGQRRAAMRASDTGAEMRVEDRWATVRRQWRPEADDRRWLGTDYDSAQRPASGPPRRDGPRREPPALPAAEDVPSWNSADWEEPEPRPRGRRRRGDEGPDSYPTGHRRLNFELSDERWR